MAVSIHEIGFTFDCDALESSGTQINFNETKFACSWSTQCER